MEKKVDGFIIYKANYKNRLFVHAKNFDGMSRPFFVIARRVSKATVFRTSDIARAALDLFMVHDKSAVSGEWRVISFNEYITDLQNKIEKERTNESDLL